MTRLEVLALLERVALYRLGVDDPEMEVLLEEGKRRERERFDAWVASGRCPLTPALVELIRSEP